MKDALTILREARALIASPDTWCQGAYELARGEKIQYCSVGAIRKVALEQKECDDCTAIYAGGRAIRILNAVIGGIHGIPHYNDSHTHEEVIAAFDKAIRTLVIEELKNGNGKEGGDNETTPMVETPAQMETHILEEA